MFSHRKSSWLLSGVVLLLAGAGLTSIVEAQSPISNAVLAGYGSAGYTAEPTKEFVNDFTASISPVLLFTLGDDMLFESELEFGLSGSQTTTSLEYAQLDYVGFERVILVGGKFLLPFGLFSERLHPTWINKLPSPPLLYGHAHGGVAEGALLPVMSDAGVMARYKHDLGSSWALVLSGWVSQGPQLIDGEGGDGHDDDGHDDEHAGKTMLTAALLDGDPGDSAIPLVGFGIGFADNNKNKMLGGRLGVVHGPHFEAYVSGFTSRYDEDNFLSMDGVNLSGVLRPAGFEILFEGTVIWQEIPHDDGYEVVEKPGFYAQVARRYGRFEPVARWSQLFESTLGKHDTVQHERRQLALGINYWIAPSIPLKLAYEIEFDGQDRILVQWAYGF